MLTAVAGRSYRALDLKIAQAKSAELAAYRAETAKDAMHSSHPTASR